MLNRFGSLLMLCLLLVLTAIAGCTSSTEKFNRQMAKEQFSEAHDECWRLFSRIDPQRKKEYQACMKEKGWLIK